MAFQRAPLGGGAGDASIPTDVARPQPQARRPCPAVSAAPPPAPGPPWLRGAPVRRTETGSRRPLPCGSETLNPTPRDSVLGSWSSPPRPGRRPSAPHAPAAESRGLGSDLSRPRVDLEIRFGSDVGGPSPGPGTPRSPASTPRVEGVSPWPPPARRSLSAGRTRGARAGVVGALSANLAPK